MTYDTLESKNRLVCEHLFLADRLAAREHRSMRFLDLDELKSAAYFGLVQASRSYDPVMCDNFAGYAYFRMVGSIRDYHRELGWGPKKQNFRKQAFEEPTYEDPSDFEDFLNYLTDGMSEQSRELFRRRYLLGEKVKEIGEKTGVDSTTVSKQLHAALRVVRKRWKDREVELWSAV